MLIIKCALCNQKLIKYIKFGKGKLLRCWKSNIIMDMTNHEENKLLCKCGSIIGVDKGAFITLKQSNISYKGTTIY